MNNINKHFCSYEISKELKELGFDEECMGLYDTKGKLIIKPFITQSYAKEYFGSIVSPLISQALEFLREKYKLAVIPSPFGFEIADNRPDSTMNGGYPWGCIVDEVCENYEQAQEAGILKAIELIKQKK